jgi:hypothetical protein
MTEEKRAMEKQLIRIDRNELFVFIGGFLL